MKVTLCFGLILTIAVAACLCRPSPEAAGTGGSPRQRRPPVRRDWPESLSQLLPHALTELNKHEGFVHEDEGLEALHEHYYPDWMDFGRRSAEDAAGAA